MAAPRGGGRPRWRSSAPGRRTVPAEHLGRWSAPSQSRGRLACSGLAAELERVERSLGRGHQPAEALLEDALDVAGVDVRMAARDAGLGTDRQDFVDRGGDDRVLVLSRIAEV